MKKRLLSLVLCLVMVFSLLPFGASAQIYPITDESVVVEIRFHDTDGSVSTQRVNNVGGSVAEGAIYDPGCTVGENQVFAGWAIGNASATPGSVEAIRSYVNTNFNRLTTTGLDVYAVTSAVRYLVYYDETGRVLKTVSATVTGNTDPSVTVDQSYVPQSPEMNFAGWTTVKDGTTVQYENGVEITLSTAETKLYPVSKTGYWLSFSGNIEKNDNDPTTATYTAPVFFGQDDPTVAPTAPTRPGYRFVGWYADDAMTTPFDFGGTLTKDTKIYAKWEASGTVQYRVVFWQQKATDAVGLDNDAKTYDYYAKEVIRYAAAGSNVTINTADSGTTADNRLGGNSTNSIGEMGFYFTYNGAKSDTDPVMVKGDGSTVLNVYYDRKTITFNFYTDSNLRTKWTDTAYVPAENGEYYYYNDSNATGYYLFGWENGPRGTAGPNNNETVYEYYGYYVSNLNDTVDTYRNSDPYYNETYRTTDTSFYTNNAGFYFQKSSSRNRYYPIYYHYNNQSGYYKVGTGPDKTAVGTYNQEAFNGTLIGLYGSKVTGLPAVPNGKIMEYTAQNSKNYYTAFIDAFEIKYTTTAQTENYWLTNYSANSPKDIHQIGQDTDGNYTVELAKDIIDVDERYYYGNEDFVGFTGHGHNLSTNSASGNNFVPAESDGSGSFSYSSVSSSGGYIYYNRNQWTFSYSSRNVNVKTTPAYYQKALDEYSNYEPTNGPDGYFFDGWYADPGFNTPFDFNSTMPNASVTVYAKWTPKQYRVVLDLDGGDFNVATQQDTFDLGYLSQINGGNEVGATKADHQLVGWYLPDGTRFNFADTLLTDAIAEAFTADDNPAVKGKVTLTAHWRKVLTGNETLKVRYDAKGGTINGEPTHDDSRSYADMAQAIAQAAAAPGVAGQNFSYWQVMQYTENGFVEKTVDGELVKVNPGETFEVLLNDAKQDGNTYYVYLEARYASAGKTHANWVANNGNGMDYKASENTAINSEITIEPANTFSYPGHVFLGWAKLDEYDATSAPNGVKYDETNGWDQQPVLTADNLWLIWDETAGENGAFRVNTGNKPIARAIGADQIKPYEVLYAVWEKYETNEVRLMDYGVTGTIATDVLAGSLKADAGFQLVGNTLTFRYSDADAAFEADTGDSIVGWSYNYSGIASAKTATYRDTNNKLHKVTVVAASSAYFDDDLNGATKTALDGSGVLNSEIAQNAKDTDGTNITRITINFIGTGIDVYCTSASDSGRVSYKLDGVGGVMVNKNGAEGATYYNAPTIRKLGLDYGPHELVITCGAAAKYKLDGIRIYGATEDTNQATELKAVYQNLRTILQEAGAVSSEEVAGAVFVPGGEAADKGYKDGTINEIMLSSDQGVAFQVDGMATADKMYVGLASATGEEVKVTVSYGDGVVQAYSFSNTIHTFYEVKTTGSGYVYIKNTGDNLVSVTDLKIVPTAMREFSFKANAPLMRYVESFSALPQVSEIVEPTPEPSPLPSEEPEPSPSAEPDPTPTTSITSIIRQLISSFVQSLFGSVSRLFGRP